MGVVMVTANFLGKFRVEYNARELTEANVRSEMLVKLMMYLVMNRSHLLSVQELTDALWEEQSVDNPSGALKNLMYRLRMKLKETFQRDDFVLSGRGYYSWNQEIEICVDVEQFVFLIKKAEEQTDLEVKKEALEQAISLYTGDFGSNYRDNYWIMTQTTYYHSVYITAVKTLAEIYQAKQEYSKTEAICGKALKFDMTDERLHELIIRAMLAQDKLSLAQIQYEDARRILMETMGIRHSDILDQVGKEIHKKKKTEMLSLEQMMDESQKKDEPGAFGCSYQVFKEIYRLETKKIERLGMAEYLGLFTVDGDWVREDIQQELMSDYVESHAMDQLEKIVQDNLRCGDAYTRINDKQLMILLPGCTYESTKSVMERVKQVFARNYQKQGIHVKTDIHEIGE